MNHGKYKYQLRKGSKKDQCPACKHYKCFVPYVLASDNTTLAGPDLGRCERINSCGYIKCPRNNADFNSGLCLPQYVAKRPVDFIPRAMVEATFRNFKNNMFFKYLERTFDIDTAQQLQQKYNIGTAKGGGTIFWQQDNEGNFRTGKVMYYGDNGRRVKSRNSWYVHNRVKKDYSLEQVFFGEHLTTIDTQVALCESEKTAVMMSVIMPKLTWVAAGGSEMINAQRLGRLPRLDHVYPDNGMRAKWEAKTGMFDRKVDFYVDQAVANGKLPTGADILDLFLL